ncbi:MAG TPA: DUF2076 family protein, partial [Burkholderiales bacterium]|nr:DUF2076 family protein [Burkholderiales bacterium]
PMNAQERTLLVEFLDQMIGAQAGRKDAEADSLIREAVSRQPDAAYLLVQRALQLEQALQITQAELKRLQAEGGPQTDAGFLGNANTWGRSPANTTPAGTPVGAPPAGAATPAAAPGAAPMQQRWGSGMLGNVAATAAGVVAGSFLFHGVQNLLGRHGTDAPWNSAAASPLPRENGAADESTDEALTDDSVDTASWDDGGDSGGDFA